MTDLKEALKIAKMNSEEDNLVEAYENEDNYIFIFMKEAVETMNDGTAIAVGKKNGSVKELFGQEMGVEINVKESKEIPLEEINGMNLF